MKLRAVATAANSMLPGITEPNITEPSSVISSSTKRSFSERDATSDSRLPRPEAYQPPKRPRLALNACEETISSLRNAQKLISSTLDTLRQLHGLIPDIGVQSGSETIEVAVDGVGDDSSDDSSNTRSSTDDTESEAELTNSQSRDLQHRSTQRRRWTEKEEKLLRALKATQKRNGGKPSDYQIASRLDRTESGVKQHWDIMSQKKHR